METLRVLLNTSELLAALMGPDRLNEATRELLVEPARDVRFSAASVWEVAIKRSLRRERFDFDPAEVHELAVRSIQYSSKRGESVLDLFGGSGSTLIGCEQTDRRALLMEMDEAYCDVIVKRWAEFTGRKAERHAAAEGSEGSK